MTETVGKYMSPGPLIEDDVKERDSVRWLMRILAQEVEHLLTDSENFYGKLDYLLKPDVPRAHEYDQVPRDESWSPMSHQLAEILDTIYLLREKNLWVQARLDI